MTVPMVNHISANRFAAEYWENSPVVLAGQQWQFGSEKEAFEAAQEASRLARAGMLEREKDIKFYVGGAELLDPTPMLPRASENTFDEYVARISGQCAEFTLMVHSVQTFHDAIWRKSRKFLQQLIQQTGTIPSGGIDAHLMIARYRQSPYIIHKDPSSVFVNIIRGQKDMHVWPFDTFADQAPTPDAFHRHVKLLGVNYEDHIHTGERLEGLEGSTHYWPSSYWHVGLADPGALHVSLHLTCMTNSNPVLTATDILNETAQALRHDSISWHTTYAAQQNRQQNAASLPEELEKVAEEMLAGLNTRNLRSALNIHWLALLSAQGFVRRKASSLSADFDIAEIEPDPDFQFLWTVDADGVFVAAHGRVLCFETQDWLPALLERICSGRVSIQGLYDDPIIHSFACDQPKAIVIQQIQSILFSLAEIAAIRPVERTRNTHS